MKRDPTRLHYAVRRARFGPKRSLVTALTSKLFRGDPNLEAAAVCDRAHILPGATGAHVGKIQLALIKLDGADIDQDWSYGPRTAAAVRHQPPAGPRLRHWSVRTSTAEVAFSFRAKVGIVISDPGSRV